MKLTLVTNYDDWEGLYIDGVLYTEGHEVTLKELAEALGVSLETKEISRTWIYDNGSLPRKLEDVKLSE